MPLLDHLGITVADLDRGREQFAPVLAALGYDSGYGDDHSLSWNRTDETEIILMAPRDDQPEPHRHGRVGWQHLAFAVPSREEVDRMHAIAVDAGWTAVRAPKEYPRFTDRYYASFVEDDGGIRIEFMHNPPNDA